MKKKFLSVLLVAAMAASMVAGCGSDNAGNTNNNGTTDNSGSSNSGSSDSGSSNSGSTSDNQNSGDVAAEGGNITIWVTEKTVDVTKELANKYLTDNGLNYTVTVEPVGEGDASTNMITDVASGADIFGFAQDQLSRLVSAGAIQALNADMSAWVAEKNSAGSVSSAQVGGTTYAFPMTDDNGYFMYYDKSVVTNPSSLEQIIADCEAAGKGVYFDMDSAWYNAAFFFATGCTCVFNSDNEGNFTSVDVSYASDKGIVALREMIDLAASPAFVDGSSVGAATNIGAIIDGNWDAGAAQTALGENYAAAELPSFVGSDGNTYHLSSFSGVKLMGVKPQEDPIKLAVCYGLAQYLTDYDAQMARFANADLQWGPSNLAAQADPSVATEALQALSAQNAYAIPQGNYPGDWWDLAGAIGGSVMQGEITAANSDDELLAVLQKHDDGCYGFIQ